MKYYSQYKQDAHVDKIFSHKRGGRFVDIGAHNGIIFSNTYFLEKMRGWNGICIEPIPEFFDELKQNRNCITIQGCISNKTTVKKFSRVTGKHNMLSGLSESMTPEHLNRLKNDIRQHGGEIIDMDVQCYTLNEILDDNNLHHIDYCSIDTEGSELDILKSIDFRKFDFNVFSIENDYVSADIRKVMRSNGYKLMKILGSDEIYIKRELFYGSPYSIKCYLTGLVKNNIFVTKYRRWKKARAPGRRQD